MRSLLMLKMGGGKRSSCQRGITLQTLIVTAVLVLMAVAAGVVIVAITNSSQDDLEEQSPDLESRCTGTEIYDIELAVAGVEGQVTGYALGGNRVVKGSDIGCIPVCFWNDGEMVTELHDQDGKIDPTEIFFSREPDPNEIPLDVAVPTGGVLENPTTLSGFERVGVNPMPGVRNVSGLFDSSLTDPEEVRVGPSQDDCYIYNSSGEIIG